MNHDGLFKQLLGSRAILRAFLEQFAPQIASGTDLDYLEPLDKERHSFEGRRFTGDLLFKTRSLRGHSEFLIHIEHQAQHDPGLVGRMLVYVILDWHFYKRPVHAIAVLSYSRPAFQTPRPRVELDDEPIMLGFSMVDLGRMEAREFVKIRNPAALALAARMRFDEKEKIRLTLDFFTSLAEIPLCPKEQKLVSGFFNAYHPLSGCEALQLRQEVSMITPDHLRGKVMQLTNPFIEIGRHEGFEQGREQGREQGIRQGRKQGIEQGRREEAAEFVLRLLARRFGRLDAAQKKRIERLPLARLEALGESLLDFQTRADLADWLKQNGS